MATNGGGSKRWRMRIDGQETSAVNLAALRSMIERGDVLPATPVCEEGSDWWREAVFVPELNGLFATPPKSPPTSTILGVPLTPPGRSAPIATPPATLDDIVRELRGIREANERADGRVGCLIGIVVVIGAIAAISSWVGHQESERQWRDAIRHSAWP